jgi:hypothetical protein
MQADRQAVVGRSSQKGGQAGMGSSSIINERGSQAARQAGPIIIYILPIEERRSRIWNE